MRSRRWLLLACSGLLCCGQAGRVPGTRPRGAVHVAEPIYQSGLSSGWNDYGWATRELVAGQPARLDFAGKAGWIVARPDLKGRFGGLAFRYRAPPEYGDFLEARVESTQSEVFPRVPVGAGFRADTADGWCEVLIPMEELNPNGSAFDRIVLRAAKKVGHAPVELDDIGFTAALPRSTTGPRFTAPLEDVTLRVDCSSPTHPIKPAIYGIAFDPRLDGTDTQQWELGATARRWGGNSSTRYNWELGHAWNTGNDWFFRNVNYTGLADYSYANFLEDDVSRRLQTALTLPIMGWVAKDFESPSFPLSVFPSQRRVDPTRGDAGDGVTKDGKPILPGPPTRTSVQTSPRMIGKWISAIRALDAARGARSVQMYILDNEPMLWNSTHRDVHPEPVGYDELLERTIAYGSAVRQADPQAVIAGPAEWGWPAYFYSAIDSAAGFRLKPDRRAHGDVPLLAWYLQKLKAHEEQTGERVLDVVDLHFYSQGKGLAIGTAGGTDPEASARRLRGTRSLWDPTYVDESWINEPIELIPRLRRLIQENYPGRGISIGEYNFGAENHISGGLALAEALGRFGQEGIDAAFYWTYPPKDSHAFWAFRAYRNFDGKGGRFQELSVPTAATRAGVSLFASKDAAGQHLVLVALNLQPATAFRARIDLSTCGTVGHQRLFTDTAQEPGLFETPAGANQPEVVRPVLPPYSITVIDLSVTAPPSPPR